MARQATVTRRTRRNEELLALVVGGVGALWRWRLELGLLGLFVGVQVVLATLVGGVAAAVVVLALVGAVLATPGTWRRLDAGVVGGADSAGVVARVDGLRAAAGAGREGVERAGG